MAGYTKRPDKKTIVAIVIIAVLLIAAIIGTVAFLKNRGTAEATDLASYNEQETGTTQEEQPTTTDTQEQSGEPATQSAEEQATEGTEAETTEPTETADTATTGGANQGTTGTGATGTTDGATGTTTTTDNIQETTISREETVTIPERLVAEGEDKIWSPTELNASFASAYTNIENVQTPDITVTKTATTQSGNHLVQAGETITYTITVQNNTNEKVERIFVTDKIPANTTYVSSMGDVETFTDTEGNVTSLRWLVDVDANATTTVEFSVEVNEDATGTISNVAIANGEESNEGNPTETSIIKADKTSVITREGAIVDTAKVGDVITYTISVQNTGAVEGTTTIKDADLATILENNAEMQGNVVIKAGDIVIDDTKTAEDLIAGIKDITVPAESTVTVEFSIKVTNIDGEIKNVAIIGDNEEENPEDVVDTVNIIGEKENKDEDGIVKPGDPVTYEIKLSNSGTIEGTTTVVDNLPAGVEYVSSTNNGVYDAENRTVTWENVSVAPGTDTTVLKVEVKVTEGITAGEQIKNTGTVGTTPIEDEDPLDTVNITGEKENKDEDGIVKPGDPVTYEIKLSNSGTIEGTTTVVDNLPAGVEYVSSTNNGVYDAENRTVTWENVSVAPGTDTTVLKVEVKVTEGITVGEQIKNTGTVGTKPIEDEDPLDTVNIIGTKTHTANLNADGTINPGTEFTYTITLTNSGTVPGTVTVTDELDSNQLEVLEAEPATKADGSAVVNGNNVDFGDVTVEPGTPRELIIHVKVKANATGTISNTAYIHEGENEEEPVKDPEDIPIDEFATIKAKKVHTEDDNDNIVKPGDEVTYTITLSNSGNVAGTTTVSDRLPEGVTFVNDSITSTAEVAGMEYNSATRTITWKDVKVPVGTDTATLTFRVTVDENATNTILNSAVVSGIDDPVEDEKEIEVVNITATKNSNVQEGTKATVGQTVTYTITATNNGTVQGNTVVTDRIPTDQLDDVQVVATSIPQGDTAVYENGVVTWNVKNLAPGKENARTLQITATIKDFEGTAITITNGVNVDNNEVPDDEEVIEVGKAVIDSSKTSEIISCDRGEKTGKIVHEGDKIKYAITVNNAGTVGKAINISDEIKAGLTYVEGTLRVEFAGEDITENAGATVETTQEGKQIVKLENYTLGTTGTLTIEFTVQVNTLSDSESSKVIDENVAVVDGANTPGGGDYTVEKPVITTTKTSSITSCNKEQTEGTIVHEGDQITYRIEIANSGNASGEVTIQDTLPAGVTYQSLSAKVENQSISGISADGNEISGTYTLDAGKTLVIEITAQVNNLAEGVYGTTIPVNTVTVNNEPKTDIRGEYTVVKPHIKQSKTSSITKCDAFGELEGNTVHEGDRIKYTIIVANDGTDSDVVTVTDVIPDGVTLDGDTLQASVTEGETQPQVKTSTIQGNKTQVAVNAYTLEGGATLTITFEVTVNTLDENVYSGTIEKNIAYVNTQPTPDDSGYEVEKPQTEATKSVDKTKAEYGDILTYTITAKNLSSVTAPVNISDDIPDGTEYVPNSITVNGKKVSDEGHYVVNDDEEKVVYTGELTKQNETLTLTFQVKVTLKEAFGDKITNTANVNGDTPTAETTLIKQVNTTVQSSSVIPIDLVLVLDTSSSMDQENRIQNLRDAANDLVDKVFANRTDSTISIVKYAKEASTLGTYNYNQKSNLKYTISNLKAPSSNSGTYIYGALEETIDLVNGFNSDRPTIVVFLTDGSPTIPDSEYISGIYNDTNYSSGFAHNVKDLIEQKATELQQAVGETGHVYSIGLSVESLSDSTISYAEKCTVEEITSKTSYDNKNHTFTITLTNPAESAVTLDNVRADFSDVESIESADNNGQVTNNWRNNYVTWRNITIGAGETITLTGSYEPEYGYRYTGWGKREEYEKAPVISVDTGYNGVCVSEEHNEMFNGKPLYSEIRTNRGTQYHCITQKDYAKYLLSKISTDGKSMNVNDVSVAFDEILNGLTTHKETYTLEEGSVLEIPETRTIITDVTVKIGDSTNTYSLNELRRGVDGLKYVDDKGFEWTITGETLLTSELSLEYKVSE